MTMIALERLRFNPYRDFELHPLDPVQVERLKASINADGFWASVVARKYEDNYEIAFGHHRIEAARLLGWAGVPIEVRDLSDWQMVRMLASENATQRGSTAAACLDAVAAISKVLAYNLLRWDEATFCEISQKVAVDYASCRGRLESGSGIGRDCVEAFTPVGAFTRSQIESALGTLKDSGRMSLIIAGAHTLAEMELRAEQEAAEQALEEAKRREAEARDAAERDAAAKATKTATREVGKRKRAVEATGKAAGAVAKKPVIYDARCAQLFRLDFHAETFRKVVTGETFQAYLPLSQQFEFAKEVIARATENRPKGHAMTAAELRAQCWSMIQTGVGRVIRDLRTAPERPYLLKIRDGLNFIRRAVADHQRGAALLMDAVRAGEVLDEEQQVLLANLTADIVASVQVLKPLHGRQPLKIVGGKDVT